MDKRRIVFRGEIWYANLEGNRGSEQGGVRPVLIIQNDGGNQVSTTTIVLPITTSPKSKRVQKFHVPVMVEEPSYILTEQIRTLCKSRLVRKVGEANRATMNEVERILKNQLGMGSW